MDLNMYIFIWVCIIGLCLGSFYNVVILRSLSGESIVFPPSKCPKCGNKLKPWHNIPILSYMFLGGKCYFCKEKISLQYPVIEFITMILFVYSFFKFGINITTPFIMFWLSLLLIMTVTDIKEHLVDCNLAIIIGISGIISSFLIGGLSGIISSVLGILAGIIIFQTITLGGKFILKTDVMGEADTYVAAALGGAFGIYNLPIILVLGLFSYAIIFIPIFIFDKLKRRDYPTVISFITLIMLLGLFLYTQNLITYVLLLLVTIFFVYSMFKSIDKDNKMKIPYVPAFAVGTLLFIIFFMQGLVYDNSILSDTITKLLYFYH